MQSFDRTLLRLVILCIVYSIFILVLPERIIFPDDDSHRQAMKIYGKGRIHATELELAAIHGRTASTMLTEDINGRKVFVKPPGYGIWLSLLNRFGLYRASNILNILFLCAVTVYVMCKVKNKHGDLEQRSLLSACVLLLFAPVSMIMCYRVFMDDCSSTVLISAGLLLYYLSFESRRLRFAFFAGLLTGMAVTFRNTSIFSLAVVVVWEGMQFLNSRKKPDWLRTCVFIGGLSLFLIPLLLYYRTCFGSFFVTGYNQRSMLAVGTYGSFIGLSDSFFSFNSIFGNFADFVPKVIMGIPFILLSVPGYLKGRAGREKICDFLLIWIIVYGLAFLFYSIPAQQEMFVLTSRKFLPLVLPVSMLSAFFLSGLTARQALVTGLITVIVCLSVFADYSKEYISDPSKLDIHSSMNKNEFKGFLDSVKVIEEIKAGEQDLNRNGRIEPLELRMIEIYKKRLSQKGSGI